MRVFCSYTRVFRSLGRYFKINTPISHGFFVFGDLFSKGFGGVKTPLGTDEFAEFGCYLAPVQVALEIEQVKFQNSLTISGKSRFHTQIGHCAVSTPVEFDDGGVNSVGGIQSAVYKYVGSRVAQLPPDLVAFDNCSAQLHFQLSNFNSRKRAIGVCPPRTFWPNSTVTSASTGRYRSTRDPNFMNPQGVFCTAASPTRA